MRTCEPPNTIKLKWRPPAALKASPGPRCMGVKGIAVADLRCEVKPYAELVIGMTVS